MSTSGGCCPSSASRPGRSRGAKDSPVLVEELEALHHLRERRREQLVGGIVAAQASTGLVRVDQLAARPLNRDAVTEAVEHQAEILAERECAAGPKVRFDRHRLPPMFVA